MKNFTLGILTTIIVLNVLKKTILKNNEEQKILAKSNVSPRFKNAITRSGSYESFATKNML